MTDDTAARVLPPDPTWRMLPADPNTTRLHQSVRAAEARQRAAEQRAADLAEKLREKDAALRELQTQVARVTEEYQAVVNSNAYRWGSRLAVLKSRLTGRRGARE